MHLVQAVLRRIQSLRNNALFFVNNRRQRTNATPKCFAKERACLKLSAVLSALARTAIGANEHRGSLATSAAENGLSSSKKHFGKGCSLICSSPAGSHMKTSPGSEPSEKVEEN